MTFYDHPTSEEAIKCIIQNSVARGFDGRVIDKDCLDDIKAAILRALDPLVGMEAEPVIVEVDGYIYN